MTAAMPTVAAAPSMTAMPTVTTMTAMPTVTTVAAMTTVAAVTTVTAVTVTGKRRHWKQQGSHYCKSKRKLAKHLDFLFVSFRFS
jgi:hypothetical protein